MRFQLNFGTSHPLPPFLEGGGKSAPTRVTREPKKPGLNRVNHPLPCALTPYNASFIYFSEFDLHPYLNLCSLYHVDHYHQNADDDHANARDEHGADAHHLIE